MKEIRFTAFGEDADRREVKRALDARVRSACWAEGATGLPGDITWMDSHEPLASHADAVEFLGHVCNGPYDCRAVKYMEPEGEVRRSAKLIALQGRAEEIRKKNEALDGDFYFKDRKSRFVTCKGCGSKLSVDGLRQSGGMNCCPLCGTDLRPDTALKKIASGKEAAKKVHDQIAAEWERLEDAVPKRTMWLVRYGYHS